MLPYTVVAYSADALKAALVEGSYGKNEDVRNKSHAAYLDGYLREIGARTMVVEQGYVDRDFLEDFAAYHVRCFAGYERTCTRLHFFSQSFDERNFEERLLRRDSVAALQSSYLGFVVVKPLPQTVIGRTCLGTYPANPAGRQRFFPTLRSERASLFGIELEVRSLPFQEQDQDVAACASSALWTVLNGTARLFQHAMPSPVDITKAAGHHLRMENRQFPAGDGLNSIQMADAIRSIGLEPHALGAHELSTLRIAVLAYLRIGIPGLLAGRLYSDVPGQPRRLRGGHAIAVTGYGLPDGATGGAVPNGRRFKALAVDRMYCHDDQIGPFAKLGVEPSGLVTDDPSGGKLVFEPTVFIIPLYHKIRISVMRVFDATHGTDIVLEAFRQQGFVPFSERVTWDVRLSTVNELRRELAESQLDDVNKRRLLTRDYPRFVWRVEVATAGAPIFEAVLDATDLLQGQHLVDIVPYDKVACQSIAAALPSLGAMLTAKPDLNRILGWFIRNSACLQ